MSHFLKILTSLASAILRRAYFYLMACTGSLAAAYVNGLQSKGVAATIKHFVGNDQEHERTAAESVMSDRALREIYLYPQVTPQ